MPLFRAAKVLPVQRGGGMKQPGMLAAEQKLKEGQWVHIFPEGTRSQVGVRRDACVEVMRIQPSTTSIVTPML